MLFLSALLLKPLFLFLNEKIEKPIVLLAIDNSQSVKNTGEVSLEALKSFKAQFDDKFEIETVLFGQEIKEAQSPTYADVKTDYSELMQYVRDEYKYRNLGGMVLFSDGIYNLGQNPLYEAWDNQIPIYTVGLGDPTPYKDLRIQKVWSNKVAYLHNTFEVEVQVQADLCKGQNATLTILNASNQILFSQAISFREPQVFKTFTTQLPANNSGVQKYTVNVSHLDQEKNLKNNHSNFYVEVIDRKKKIAIVSNQPSPDVAAFAKSWRASKLFEIQFFNQINAFETTKNQFDVLVLHGHFKDYDAYLKSKEFESTPTLFLPTLQNNISQIANYFDCFTVDNTQQKHNTVSAYLNENFIAFSGGENSVFSEMPPVQTFFGNLNLAQKNAVFLMQKIGPLTTQYPLLFFDVSSKIKHGFFIAEGFFRWPLYEYKQTKSTQNFELFSSKIIQYISDVKQKKQLYIQSEPSYYSYQNIEIEAELFDNTYQPVANQEVTLKLVNQNKESFEYIFSSFNNRYKLSLGFLPKGTYTLKASCKVNDQILTDQKTIYVKEKDLENANLQANFSLLQKLSKKTAGQFYSTDQVQNMPADLSNNSAMVSVSKYEKSISSIIEFKSIFFILFIFLCIEWIMRKYFSMP